MNPGEFERLRHPWESLADWGGTVEMPITGGRPWRSPGPPPGVVRRRGASVVLAGAGSALLVLAVCVAAVLATS